MNSTVQHNTHPNKVFCNKFKNYIPLKGFQPINNSKKIKENGLFCYVY